MVDVRGIVLYVLLVILRSRASQLRITWLRRMQDARRNRWVIFRRIQAVQRFVFVMMTSIAIQSRVLIERSVWMRDRSNVWWDRIVGQCFSASDWLENFRMSQGTFQYICIELKPIIEKKDSAMRQAIPLEQRVAIALWRLATNSEYRTIAHLFGVSRSSVCVIVQEVCDAIVQLLLPKYIQVPQGARLRAIVEGFEQKWGYPQCVGAIDGSHIPIVSPGDYPADYHNRKGWHSIIVQAVVDHECRFWNINVGWPGRVHDARVLSNSILFQQAEAGTLLPHLPRVINNVAVPLVILGDPAYPLLPWLMKPYLHYGSISDRQKNYNYRHSRARMVVENAFGRLKGRWRCLLKRNDAATDNVPTLITACCVLHNVCEVHKEQFDNSWLEDVNLDPPHESSASRNQPANSSTAEAIRHAICYYMNP